MSKLKSIILQGTIALSGFLTALQIKAARAQMAYMPAPQVVYMPEPSPSSANTTNIITLSSNFLKEHTGWAIVIGIFVTIGLIIAIKYLLSLFIKLIAKK